jgi:hypothetical protein
LGHQTNDSVHVAIKEQLSVTLLRDGGVQDFELKGDLNLLVSDASLSKLKLTLADKSYSDLQFKQHPNVAKFGAGEKVIALKDASRSFPVGQGLGVLRWRMTAKDESNVPLSSESLSLFDTNWTVLMSKSPVGLSLAGMDLRMSLSSMSLKLST